MEDWAQDSSREVGTSRTLPSQDSFAPIGKMDLVGIDPEDSIVAQVSPGCFQILGI